MRDARGVAQVVLEDEDFGASLSAIAHESVLDVEGLVTSEPQAPGGVELKQPTIRVLVESVEPPVDLYRPALRAQLPTILDHAAVSLRHPRRRVHFQLAAASLSGFRAALRAKNFVEIQTPKIVAAATEGGANLFPVNYFGRPAFLAQSPQFYKQIMVGVFERVFEVGPVFRAEPHDTPRHLNEYVSLDAEMGFIDDHRTVMAVLRDVLASMVATIEDDAETALRLIGVRPPHVPDAIPVVHFTEALTLVGEATGQTLTGELDLAPAHEAWLGQWAAEKYGSDFLFVSGFPAAKRPFYTHPDPSSPAYTNSFDLLFRGLELVTGGQRLHRYDDYLAALKGRQMDAAPFESYLEAFRHGMPPHGGFAIGLERWVARMVGAANVRETTLFPRDLNRLTP